MDYKVHKIQLSKILKNDENTSKLFDIIDRSNKLYIHVCQFLRCWILNLYKNDSIIPTITTDIVHMCFCSLVTESRGPKPKGGQFNDV